MNKHIIVSGLMSGTSGDGIDISLMKTNGLEFEILDNFYYEYDTFTKSKLLQCINHFNHDIILNKNKIDSFVTQQHFKALKKSNFLKKTELIGFHGQTLYHSPEKKLSIQSGNPQILSNLTKKRVVFNFRSKDLLLGGQGAPLAPIYHKLIVKKYNIIEPCCFINIGGISNLTYINKNDLIGFDTGPGNNLMDFFTKELFNEDYDKNGFYASKGLINRNLQKCFLKNQYFKKDYPKSLDKNFFNAFFNDYKISNLNKFDLIATLNEITFNTILLGIKKLPEFPRTLFVSGGGLRNKFLMKKLKKNINSKFVDLNKFKIKPDFVESQLISLLSARSYYNLPITFPNTTGVKTASTGGEIFVPL